MGQNLQSLLSAASHHRGAHSFAVTDITDDFSVDNCGFSFPLEVKALMLLFLYFVLWCTKNMVKMILQSNLITVKLLLLVLTLELACYY